MAKQSKAQQETVERVMHAFKHGALRTRGNGPKVENPKQAIAIALHEAGASNQETPKANRANLRQTKAKERRSETSQARREEGPSRAALYAEAKQRDIAGRSTMDKAALRKALAR